VDIEHILVTAIVGLSTAAAAWGAIRAEVKHLSKWQDKHDVKDDERFEHVNDRLNDIIISSK